MILESASWCGRIAGDGSTDDKDLGQCERAVFLGGRATACIPPSMRSASTRSLSERSLMQTLEAPERWKVMARLIASDSDSNTSVGGRLGLPSLAIAAHIGHGVICAARSLPPKAVVNIQHHC